MGFGWINWVNMTVVMCLVLINIIAARRGLSDRFSSKHLAVNILEQIGRYGCMVLMVLPIFTGGREFGFASVTEMLVWLCSTILLLVIYSILWVRRANGGTELLYGLAITPVAVFLMNGILLRHPALIAAAFVFGISHFAIVQENV